MARASGPFRLVLAASMLIAAYLPARRAAPIDSTRPLRAE
jgi:hypothetical protein